jgi:hypothetical protein
MQKPPSTNLKSAIPRLQQHDSPARVMVSSYKAECFQFGLVRPFSLRVALYAFFALKPPWILPPNPPDVSPYSRSQQFYNAL